MEFKIWNNKFSPIPRINTASNVNTNQKNGSITIDNNQEPDIRINYKNRMRNLLTQPEYLKGQMSVGGANFVIVDYSKGEITNPIPCGGYLQNKFAYGNNNCKLAFKL
jgi:hypothetical protein